MSTRVFVDISAYFALTDRRDDNHTLAEAAARRFTQEGAEVYTTNFIMAETHALLLNRIGRDIAAQVLERLYASETRILRATESDERRAREIIAQRIIRSRMPLALSSCGACTYSKSGRVTSISVNLASPE